jgi:hypothetical protein
MTAFLYLAGSVGMVLTVSWVTWRLLEAADAVVRLLRK